MNKFRFNVTIIKVIRFLILFVGLTVSFFWFNNPHILDVIIMVAIGLVAPIQIDDTDNISYSVPLFITFLILNLINVLIYINYINKQP